MILLTFSVIITTRQYVGNPIDCIHTDDVPDDVFDLYCWIHSTYTIPRALSLNVGDEVAHPGVLTSNVGEEDERRYVSYYQWVGFTLFFQVRAKCKSNLQKYIDYMSQGTQMLIESNVNPFLENHTIILAPLVCSAVVIANGGSHFLIHLLLGCV